MVSASSAADSSLRIGIDLGGTKTEVAVLDAQRQIVFRHRLATPRGDYQASLQRIAELISMAEAACGPACSVGIGIPGSVVPATGRVHNANSTWLNGRTVVGDLQTLLGRPVWAANDANCLALSEAVDGAAAGADSVFAIILGTGVGAGLVFHGQLLHGAHGLAGEWGHNPLPWPQPDEAQVPPCWCGLTGCLESWLSGPAIAADHQRQTGQALDGPQIVAQALAGDAQAAASLQRHKARLARALAHVINLIDPQVIVLGGGVGQLPGLTVGLLDAIQPWVFSRGLALTTRLVLPVHGDSSGVRGAAWLPLLAAQAADTQALRL